jgi:tetratricopeptide (TPR) repeat protein
MKKYLLALVMVAAFCGVAHADNPSRDRAQRQCQSSDTNERLTGCTIVIDADGFGSKTLLSHALDGRCWALNDLQQYDRGLVDCNASIALDPRYSYAYNNRGTSLLGLNDVRNAIAAFTKAIELKPNFIWPYLNRAKAYLTLGSTELARRDLESALAIDPANQDARQAIAALNQPPSTSPIPSGARPSRDPCDMFPTLCPPAR